MSHMVPMTSKTIALISCRAIAARQARSYVEEMVRVFVKATRAQIELANETKAIS